MRGEGSIPVSPASGIRPRPGLWRHAVDVRWLVLGPFIVLAVLWWIHAHAIPLVRNPIPPAQWLDVDFAVYYSAAHLTAIHANPYDHSLLYATQRSILAGHWVPANGAQVRAVYPPLFFWLLQPLTRLPFAEAAWVWNGLLVVLLVVGFSAALRVVGWSFQGWRDRLATGAALLLAFFLMPQVQTGLCSGNLTVALAAVLSVSLLAIRRHPMAGAGLLCLAWSKPTIALPIVLVILLFLTPSRRASIAGFAVGSVGLCTLSVLTCGWDSFNRWVQSLISFWRDVGTQPQLSSLSGLYVGWAGPGLRIVLGLLFLGVACLLTAACWLRFRNVQNLPIAGVAWLWVAWMLAAPYAHFYDEVLLTIPVLTLARPCPDEPPDWVRAAPALYLLLLSFALQNRYPHHVNLLALPVVAVGLYLFRTRQVTSTSGRHAAAPVTERCRR